MSNNMTRFMEILTANALRWPLPVSLLPDQAQTAYEQMEDRINRSFKEYDILGIIEIDTDSIISCLALLKEHYAESKLMWKTVYFLFLHFEKYKHIGLMPMIAEVLYFVLYETFYLRHSVGYQNEALLRIPERFPSLLTEGYSLEDHNHIWKLMKMPYRTDLVTVTPKELNIVWLATHIIESHRILPILLRQGVTYVPPSSYIHEWDNCNNVLRSLSCFTERSFQGFDVQAGFSPHTLEAKLKVYETSEKRRVFTVFRAMEVVQRKMSKLATFNAGLDADAKSNFIERYRMIFETIPEPLVTLKEVRSILERLFHPSPVNMEIINIFCEWFAILLPESVAPPTPRSLQHLCRCQVRENLRADRTFPYGVYTLDIPEMLKSYILLEDWCSSDTFHIEHEALTFTPATRSQSPPPMRQFFVRIGHGVPMLEIMAQNYQREVEAELAARREAKLFNETTSMFV